MLAFEQHPRRYAVATLAALLCGISVLALAACAINPADDAATQAAIADAVAATVVAQRPTPTSSQRQQQRLRQRLMLPLLYRFNGFVDFNPPDR